MQQSQRHPLCDQGKRCQSQPQCMPLGAVSSCVMLGRSRMHPSHQAMQAKGELLRWGEVLKLLKHR